MNTYYYIGDDLDEADLTMLRVLQRSEALIEDPDAHHVDDCDHDDCHPDDGSYCDHDYCHDECMSEDYHSEVVEEQKNESYNEGHEKGKEEAQEEADGDHYKAGHSQGYDKGFREGRENGYQQGSARSMMTFDKISTTTWYLYKPKDGETGRSYFQAGGGRLPTDVPPGNYYLVKMKP